MRMMTRLMGGASGYAHLAGLLPVRSRRASDEDDVQPRTKKKSKRVEDDEEDKDAADDDPDQYPDDNDDEPSAEDDEDDRDASEDEGDEEPKAKKKSKRVEDEDDDKDAEEDDDKDEMTGKSASARARARERSRCKAIFAHPVAAQNVALAASLAFDTTMTRQEAIAVMKGQQGRGGDDRSARRRAGNADLGPSAESSRPSGQKAAQASWDRAFKSAGIAPRK